MMSGPQPFGAPQQPQGSGPGELPQSTTLIAPPLSPPETGTSTRSVPQMSDISNDDVRFQLEFDIELEEAVSDSLETFVYLSRIGRYNEAEALFHESLELHLDSFIVVAEYVDFLMGQQLFRHLTEFLTESLRSLSDWQIKDRLLFWEFQRDEFVLLRLILKFSEIHSHGELHSALAFARIAISLLQPRNAMDPTEVEIQIVTVYLRIVRLARQNSNWVRDTDMQPLWRAGEFETWAITLAELGYYWEATEILYEMVQLLPLEQAEALSQKLLYTLQSAGLSKADQLAEISALWICSSVVAAAARVHNTAARRDQVRSQVTELFMAIQRAEVLKEYRQSCKQYFKWAALAFYIGFDDPSPPKLSELLRTAADAGDFGSFWDLADDPKPPKLLESLWTAADAGYFGSYWGFADFGYDSTINGDRSWLQENGQPHELLSAYDHVAKNVLGDQLQHLQDLNSKLSSCSTVKPSPEVVAFVRDTLAECDVFDTAFPLSSTAVSTTLQFRVPRIRYQVESQKEHWWTFLQNHEAARKAGDNAKLLLDSLPTRALLVPRPYLESWRSISSRTYGKTVPSISDKENFEPPPSSYDRPVMPPSSPLPTNPKKTSSYYATPPSVQYTSTRKQA